MLDQATVVLLVVLGVGMGIGLVAIAWRRRPPATADPHTSRLTAMGMSVGMLVGAMLGAIVWVSSGQFVFWVVFVGAGMTVGMATGMALAERR